MILEALERQSGVYGTVNAGDTIEVGNVLGEELLTNGCWKKAKTANPTASPEQVVEHNESGLPQEPIHADGADREILNTEGRKLHESGLEFAQEETARAEAEVVLPPAGLVKEDKTTPGRQTKEDKASK